MTIANTTAAGGRTLFTVEADAGPQLWAYDNGVRVLLATGLTAPYPKPVVLDGFSYYTSFAQPGIWKSDGTVDGTVQVFSGTNVNQVGVHDGSLYFTRFNPYTAQSDLWRVEENGAVQLSGTVNADTGAALATPLGAVDVLDFQGAEGGLYLRTYAPGGFQGLQFWPEGGSLTAVGGAFPSDAQIVGSAAGKLLFVAGDPWNGGTTSALFVVEGGNIARVGEASSLVDFNSVRMIDGELFFTATQNHIWGSATELYRFDGSLHAVTTAREGDPGAGEPAFVSNDVWQYGFAGDALFFGGGGGNGSATKRVDGVDYVLSRPGGDYRGFFGGDVVGDEFFFHAVNTANDAHVLVRSGAGTAPPAVVADFPQFVYPEFEIVESGGAYFLALQSGPEAFHLGYIAAGSDVIEYLSPTTFTRIVDLRVIDGTVYFTGADTEDGAELWTTDGTLDGTVMAQEFTAGLFGSGPRNYVELSEGGGNNEPTGGIVITGTPAQGQTLTLVNTLDDADGMNLVSYQWYRDGVAIEGAMGIIYTLTATDVDKAITAKASYTDQLGTFEEVESAPTADVAGALPTPTLLPLAPLQDTGISQGDGVTRIVTPTLSGTAAPGTSVRIYDGDTLLGAAPVAANGTWSFRSPTLGDGAHQLTVQAVDNSGAISNRSPALAVTIDTQAPTKPVVALNAGNGPLPAGAFTSSTALVVSGTAEAGTRVDILDGNTLVGTTQADGSGNFSFEVLGLAQGSHKIYARSVDQAGNLSLSSGSVVTVDTTPPPMPVVQGLHASTDTGASSTDGITRTTRPLLTGTAEAGTTVYFHDSLNGGGYTLIGSVVVGSTGTWSFRPAGTLGDGSHRIIAQAVDRAGNVSETTPGLVLTIDTSAPTAPTLVVSSGGTTLPNGGTSLDGDLVVSGTVEANARVELFEGGTLVGTATAGANGQFSITLSGVADGQHKYHAWVYDVAGNGASSALATVTVDANAPLAPVITGMLAVSDLGESSSDGVTRVKTPTIVGTAEAGTTIRFYDAANNELGSTLTGTNGAWSFRLPTMADGNHAITAVPTDRGGNVGAASAPLAITIDSVGPAKPTMAITANGLPVPASAVIGNLPLQISGTTEANALVDLLDGSTVLATVRADASGNYSFSPVVTEGVHRLGTRATDLAGNAVLSDTLLFTMDASAPGAPQITGLATGTDTGASATDGITRTKTPVVTGNGEAGATVQVYLDDVLVGTTQVGTGGTWSYRLPTLADGGHQVQARVVDRAGNAGDMSPAYAITVDTVAPGTGPVAVTANGTPVPNGGATDSATLVFSGSAEAGATVQILDGANVLGSVTATAEGTFSFVVSGLADGAHTLSAKATDLAGNTVAFGHTALTVDTLPPATPQIVGLAAGTDTGPSASDNVTRVNTPVLTGFAEAGSTVRFYDANDNLLGSTVASSSGAWNFRTPVLADGTYEISARATDRVGKVSAESTSLAITVDTQIVKPVLNVALSGPSRPADGYVTVGGVVGLSGSAEPGSTVEIVDGNAVIATVVAAANGSWSLDLDSLAHGTHTLTVRETDLAGNRSVSDARTVNVDLVVSPTHVTAVAANAMGYTFSGVTEQYTSIQILRDGQVVGTGQAGSSGTWSLAAGGSLDAIPRFEVRGTTLSGSVFTQQVVIGSGYTGAEGVHVDEGPNVTFVGSDAADFLHAGGGVNFFDGGKQVGTTVQGPGYGDLLMVYAAGPAEADAVTLTQLASTATGTDRAAFYAGYAYKVVNGDEVTYLKNVEAVQIQTWIDANGNGTREYGEVNFARVIPLTLSTSSVPLDPNDPTRTQWGQPLQEQYHVAFASGGPGADNFVATRDLSAQAQSLMSTWGRGVYVDLGAGADQAVGSDWGDHFVMGDGVNYVNGGADLGTNPLGQPAEDGVETFVANGAQAAAVTVTELAAGSGTDGTAYANGYRYKLVNGAETTYMRNVEWVSVNQWTDHNGNGVRDGGETSPARHIRISPTITVTAEDPGNPGHTTWGQPLGQVYHLAQVNPGLANDTFDAETDLAPSALELMADYQRGAWVDLGGGNDIAAGSNWGDTFVMGAGTNYVDGRGNAGTDPAGNPARDTVDITVNSLAAADAVQVTALSAATDPLDQQAFEAGYTHKVVSGAETTYMRGIESVNVTVWNDSNGNGVRDQGETGPGRFISLAALSSPIPLHPTNPALTVWGTPVSNEMWVSFVRGSAFEDAWDASQFDSLSSDLMNAFGRGAFFDMGDGNDNVTGTGWGDFFNMGSGLNTVDGGDDNGTDPMGNPSIDELQVTVAPGQEDAIEVVQLTADSPFIDGLAYQIGFRFKVVTPQETTYLRNIERVSAESWVDANGNGQKDGGETQYLGSADLVAQFFAIHPGNGQAGVLNGTEFDDVLSANSVVVPQSVRDQMVAQRLGLNLNGGEGNDTLTGTDYSDIFSGGSGVNWIDGGANSGTTGSFVNANRDVLNVTVGSVADANLVTVVELNGGMAEADLAAFQAGYRYRVHNPAGGETNYVKDVELVNIVVYNDANGNGVPDQGESFVHRVRSLEPQFNNNAPSVGNQVGALGYVFGTHFDDVIDGSQVFTELNKTFDPGNAHGAYVFALGGNDVVTGTAGNDVATVTQIGSHLFDGGADEGYYHFAPVSAYVSSDQYRLVEQRTSVPNPNAPNGGLTSGNFNPTRYRLVELDRWSEFATASLTELGADDAGQLLNRLNGTALSATDAANIAAKAGELGLTGAGGNGYTIAVVKYDASGNLLGVDFLKDVETVRFDLWYDFNRNDVANGTAGETVATPFQYNMVADSLTLDQSEASYLTLTLDGAARQFAGIGTGSSFSEADLDFSGLALAPWLQPGTGYRLSDLGGNDHLTATAGNDLIALGGGNDVIDGGDGDDYAAVYWSGAAGATLQQSEEVVNGFKEITVTQVDGGITTELFTLSEQAGGSWLLDVADGADSLVRPQGSATNAVGDDVLVNVEHFAIFRAGSVSLTTGDGTTGAPSLEIDLVGVQA